MKALNDVHFVSNGVSNNSNRVIMNITLRINAPKVLSFRNRLAKSRIMRMASSSDRETATQRNLPVPISPPSRAPPPPPPPPPPPAPPGFPGVTGTSRRSAVVSTLIAGAIIVGMVSGFSSSGPSAQDEKDIAMVASQIGVPGMPSPVSAVLDKQTGAVVAVVVVGRDGTTYAARVDPGNPSRMILEATKDGSKRPLGVYVLQTRYDRINLANRRQIESIFRVPKWEDALQRAR